MIMSIKYLSRRSFHRWVVLMVVIASMMSCKDSFLDEANPQSVGFDYVKDLESLTTASVGVYSAFNGANYYGRTFLVTPELMGDNAFISIRNGGRYLNQNQFTITNGDGYVTGAWTLMWSVIANANLALDAGNAIEFSSQDQSAANQILGELYACRALAYFDLVRFFAQPYNFTEDASHLGVPLVTESSDELLYPARASVAEVYQQIIADLKQAETLLSPAVKDGFFNLYGAQSLLAKVYLYMEDWANADLYASKVIDQGPYTLLSRADYVESWSGKYSSESIFEIGYTPNDINGANSIGYLTEQGGYGELLATKDLYEIYTNDDIRKLLIQPGRRVDGEDEAFFIRKYPRGSTTNDDNIKVLRLSEVYLIRAEARAESAIAGAQADLNRIVQRADPGASNITLTGQDLVDRILLERRKELAFEGNRLFDLNRKKMNLTHIQSDQVRTFEYPNNRFIMPIPYSERNANPNIEQNPGWN